MVLAQSRPSVTIEPSIADLDEHHDPIAYVISHNLHRRHLTTSQRSMVAANIANLKHGGDRKDSKVSIDTLKIDDAAKQLNVSPESVKRAKLVKDKGTTELADMVRDGKVSVDAASKVAKKPKTEQKAIVEEGPKAVKEAAKTPVPKRVSKGIGVPKGVQRYAEWRMSFCQKHDARTAAGKKVYDDWVAARRLEFKGLFEFLGRCELFWDHADDTAKDAIHEWLDQHEPDLRHAAMANEGTPLLENGTGGTP